MKPVYHDGCKSTKVPLLTQVLKATERIDKLTDPEIRDDARALYEKNHNLPSGFMARISRIYRAANRGWV